MSIFRFVDCDECDRSMSFSDFCTVHAGKDYSGPLMLKRIEQVEKTVRVKILYLKDTASVFNILLKYKSFNCQNRQNCSFQLICITGLEVIMH